MALVSAIRELRLLVIAKLVDERSSKLKQVLHSWEGQPSNWSAV